MPISPSLTTEQKYEVLSVDTRDYIAKSGDFAEWRGSISGREDYVSRGQIINFLYFMSRRDADDAEKQDRIVFARALHKRWREVAREWPGSVRSFENGKWEKWPIRSH
jgi:hypothetical protein